MLYVLIVTGCILAILLGSAWLALTLVTVVVAAIYPSLLVLLGLAALAYFVLQYWHH